MGERGVGVWEFKLSLPEEGLKMAIPKTALTIRKGDFWKLVDTSLPPDIRAALRSYIKDDFFELLKPITTPSFFDPFIGMKRGRGVYSYMCCQNGELKHCVVDSLDQIPRGSGGFAEEDVIRISEIVRFVVAQKRVKKFMVGKASALLPCGNNNIHTPMVNRFGRKYGPCGYSSLIGIATRLSNNETDEGRVLRLESRLRELFVAHAKFDKSLSDGSSGKTAINPGMRLYVVYIALSH